VLGHHDRRAEQLPALDLGRAQLHLRRERPGQEGDIFRKLIGWSVALLSVFTVLVVLQATALSWMVP
jgi:hypothetical protein